MCAGFSLKKTWRVSLCIGVRITVIRCVVYLLRIFKMFHGLMNNPVQHPDSWHAPVAATTVFGTPDDGSRKRPKHVE